MLVKVNTLFLSNLTFERNFEFNDEPIVLMAFTHLSDQMFHVFNIETAAICQDLFI